MNHLLSIRVAAAAFAAIAATGVPILSQAGSVTVNNGQVCVDTPNLSMNPAGDLIITCTPPNTVVVPTAPSCTVAPQSITTGNSATLSASCTGGVPTTFAWAALSGAPAVPTGTQGGSITVGPFAAAGTFNYTLDASNATGHSALANTSVTVTTAVTNGSCGAATQTGTFTVNNQFTPGNGIGGPAIQRGGFASAVLPTAFTTAAPGRAFYFSSVQASGTQNYLQSQYSIQVCPGDFTTAPECVWNGYPETFQKGVLIGTARSPGSICTLVANTTYYVNVRNVLPDGTTPTCNNATCALNIFLMFAN